MHLILPFLFYTQSESKSNNMQRRPNKTRHTDKPEEVFRISPLMYSGGYMCHRSSRSCIKNWGCTWVCECLYLCFSLCPKPTQQVRRKTKAKRMRKSSK